MLEEQRKEGLFSIREEKVFGWIDGWDGKEIWVRTLTTTDPHGLANLVPV